MAQNGRPTLSQSMMWLLAIMAVREPLRLRKAGDLGLRRDAAWFPGGDGQWPLLGASRISTVHALMARGAIEPAAGLEALDPVEVRLAEKWNDMRNARHAPPW